MAILIPFFIYMDIKYRRIPPIIFGIVLLVNIPVLILIYGSGWISPWHLFGSLMMCGVFFFLWKVFGSGAYGGADRNLLICIAVLMFYNPFAANADLQYANFIAFAYQAKFIAYLFLAMCCTPGIILAYNLIKKNNYSIIESVSKFPGGFPMVIPIALAFYITILWGV